MRRPLSLRSLLAIFVVALPTTLGAAPAPLELKLSCEPRSGAGRVRCALRVSAASGGRLEWADALVVAAPTFAAPLRSRVSAKLAAPAPSVEIPLGLVASGGGRGWLRVRARALSCQEAAGAPSCRPQQGEAAFELSVTP